MECEADHHLEQIHHVGGGRQEPRVRAEPDHLRMGCAGQQCRSVAHLWARRHKQRRTVGTRDRPTGLDCGTTTIFTTTAHTARAPFDLVSVALYAGAVDYEAPAGVHGGRAKLSTGQGQVALSHWTSDAVLSRRASQTGTQRTRTRTRTRTHAHAHAHAHAHLSLHTYHRMRTC
jgi:hypothetical protein